MASILVVDDDAVFRSSVARLLRGAGYEAAEAADGAQAIRLLGAGGFDAVVTDIIMPNADGIELIGWLRQHHPRTCIVAVTGRVSLGALNLLEVATKLGVATALSKPFDPDELLALLAERIDPPRV